MVRRIYWDTALAASDPGLRMLRDVVGIDRVLFGTDFPYLRRDLAVNSKQGILQSSELNDSERRAILGGNASRRFSRRFAPSRNLIEEERRMQPDFLKSKGAEAPWLVMHPLSQEDSVAAAALRLVVAPMKGKLEGTAARGPFNGIMERVAVPKGVTFEASTAGSISGWWAKPAQAREGAAIIHVHGGWFNWGTAQAFRNFAGHIALNAGTDAFIADYRLAPEHPFPAAIRDLEACYRGLVDKGITKIAFTGDSAGGNLAQVLLSIASAQASKGGIAPVGAVAFSPVTDLTLTGESFETRAEADLYFTRSQAAGLVRSYLGETDPKNPLASPLYADLSGLPPIAFTLETTKCCSTTRATM